MKTKRPVRYLSVVIALAVSLVGASKLQAQVRYVDDNAAGGGDGLAWGTAYSDLQVALTAAAAPMSGITEIRVAQGTYKPTAPGGLRTISFQLINGVTLNGGYAGIGAPNPDYRDPATQPSVLSGDLAGNDTALPMSGSLPSSRTENSFHVVRGVDVNATAVIDGFTIRGGVANSTISTSPDRFGGGILNTHVALSAPATIGATFRKCLITDNYAEFGGGFYNNQGASAGIYGCTFLGNRGNQQAGGIYTESTNAKTLIQDCFVAGNDGGVDGGGIYCRARVDLVNSVITGNKAINGGGIYTIAVTSFFSATNCTVAGNTATTGGGGVDNTSGGPSNFPQYNNCIIWGNTAPLLAGPNVRNFGSSPTFRYSNIQGSGGSGAWNLAFGTNGGGNKDANPLFVDADGSDNVAGTADDDLRLLSTSPSVDAGNNSLVPSGIALDRDGNPRFTNDIYTTDTGFGTAPIVDIGAYELVDGDGDTVPDTIDNCVQTPNTDQADGDGDGDGNACDNCPMVSNSDQLDSDSDGDGDVCDNCPTHLNSDQADTDSDGRGNVCDNCPLIANSLQQNADGDSLGDACDACPNDPANDADGDGICGDIDNCPVDANGDQADYDLDGIGDVCDPDDDNDGVLDGVDNCQFTLNALQEDNDNDTQGDACDPDDDNDGVADGVDNCPILANADQEDNDFDNLGDVCDDDDDNDGVLDGDDNCPLTANTDQEDADLDGIGDACDTCTDTDGDGKGDPGFSANTCAIDNCQLDPNPGQEDNDFDLIGDVCDPDDDNDGFPDATDNCPLVSNFDQSDTDNDGQGNACDGDDDGDGVPDATDNCTLLNNPSQTNSDGDNVGDACDNCLMVDNENQLDTDSDGVGNACDNCTADPNPDQADADGDSLGNACDPDDDNDGVLDGVDNCPLVANSDQSNSDVDSDGDACDPDDDNDGVLDGVDNCQTIANADQLDTDGDLSGDICDADDDNDGLSDVDEATAGTNPLDPDSDDDGITDGAEVASAGGTNCPSPLNPDSDNDGLTDLDEVNMGFDPCNKRPTANAAVQQLTAIGSLALVQLDGSGSSDMDDPITSLTFMWTVDSSVVCNGLNTSCATLILPLAYGVHSVTLRVTDPVGGWHETSSTVVLNPAQLSVFEIDTVNVRFSGGSNKVAKIAGEIGLPFGVNFSELDSIGTAQIVLAGVTIAPTATLNFTEHGNGGKKWRYDSNTGPITRFDIDWDGARFKYNKNHFPIEFESQLISTSETVLTLRFDKKKLGGAVTVNINNQATVYIATNGTVTGTPIIEVEKPGKEVTLTLPFPLTETSVITISGGQNRTIQVEDYLKASVGRFRIETNFNGSAFPNGVNTLPRNISASVTIGSEAYPGSDTVAAPALDKEGQHWIKSSCD